jgi:hypothetical protein
MKREATPVYTLISAAQGMEHTTDPGFLLIQKADEFTGIELRINKLGLFFFSVFLKKIEDCFRSPNGSGELLSSGSEFASQRISI